ncbi:MFS transporter [Priestia taiwanensis]|uniref:MFS transporter n=1 Tax=Priestia taiwanensis TaxID=1347902 RepID=A0A917APB5_9BACI|nr:MFS transporter [Priestia taiwanensis]MBM7362573.1 MFS family permease [Priestia taiwanensis]GGE63340.1 MFS transporter [Priestia taiwanensis]
MKNYPRSFKALWIGEIVSEFGSVAGGIINGLLLYEITGSKEWMGVLWLIYFIPSLILQFISAPFLNGVKKEQFLRHIQLIRAIAYICPVLGYMIDYHIGTIIGLILLQLVLGLIQPIYATLSFSLLPDICKEDDLPQANNLLDGTIRIMSFLAPSVTALLLFISPVQFLYLFSCGMFLVSYLLLQQIEAQQTKETAPWTKKFWWTEMKEGYRTFFQFPTLLHLTFLSSLVQFAVGATMVLSIPFIREELQGNTWEYAIFSGTFPLGYALGMILLTKIQQSQQTMYIGLLGGGMSFILLFFAPSIPLAWLCELIGGMFFPLFNAQSAALFQRKAPRDRLAQLSSVRLLLMRVTMPFGIFFASTPLFHLSTRATYIVIGSMIVLPGIFYLLQSMKLVNKTN